MPACDLIVHVHTGELCCPRCGSKEVKDNTLPIDQWVWQIRAFRVDQWSECLVCKKAGETACWFDLEGNVSA